MLTQTHLFLIYIKLLQIIDHFLLEALSIVFKPQFFKGFTQLFTNCSNTFAFQGLDLVFKIHYGQDA